MQKASDAISAVTRSPRRRDKKTDGELPASPLPSSSSSLEVSPKMEDEKAVEGVDLAGKARVRRTRQAAKCARSTRTRRRVHGPQQDGVMSRGVVKKSRRTTRSSASVNKSDSWKPFSPSTVSPASVYGSSAGKNGNPCQPSNTSSTETRKPQGRRNGSSGSCLCDGQSRSYAFSSLQTCSLLYRFVNEKTRRSMICRDGKMGICADADEWRAEFITQYKEIFCLAHAISTDKLSVAIYYTFENLKQIFPELDANCLLDAALAQWKKLLICCMENPHQFPPHEP